MDHRSDNADDHRQGRGLVFPMGQGDLEQEFLKRLRRVDLDTTLRGSELSLIPAPGRHWFWYQKRPFWVWFYRSEDNKGWNPKRTEALMFRTIGRDQKFLKSFVNDVVA